MSKEQPSMPKESLQHKTVLITGAAVRIGRETALAFAREGADVVIHYNSSERHAIELRDILVSTGRKAWVVQADFRKPDQIESLIPKVIAGAGHIDILVNNASWFPQMGMEELTLENLLTNLTIDAWAPFALSRSFAQKTGKGSIVNLIDQRITSFDWKHTGYLVSKNALMTFTRMCAVAFAPAIRVNAVAPGLILPPPGESMSMLENLAGTVPLKRHGDPSDVAEAVLFLASSSFITGEIIFVDGGRHLQEYR
jgi:NAD(P)-dependent dehydrogenase (short-subunit alcohol dehydrogenase family)